jgi:hypothetical protein
MSGPDHKLVEKFKSPRRWTSWSLIVIAVALVYSLYTLGISSVHEFKSRQAVHITLKIQINQRNHSGVGGATAAAIASDADVAIAAVTDEPGAATTDKESMTAKVKAPALDSYTYEDAGLLSTSVPFKLPACLRTSGVLTSSLSVRLACRVHTRLA